MCSVCNKSKCCCKTTVITKQGLQGKQGKDGKIGPQGPQGVTGPGFVKFVGIPETLESTITNFDTSAVTESGDYIVLLELNVEKVGVSDISFNSYLRKNGVNDNLNINYQHLNRTSGLSCTHTHTAKVSLLVGQTAGYQLSMSSSAKILNGSIVLSKILN